uniref:Transmembrane protein 229B n=1 Tax=Poecilia latipinna TaxID=48699 RepID=A0A3B3UPH2_9TELE
IATSDGPPHPLSALFRLYVYALHGCLCEVAFTAVYDWCSTRDQRLPGHSSIWALPMYGSAIFCMEALRAWLLAQSRSLPVRLAVYTLFIYMWEFSWGVGLSLLGACPWDYSAHRYNLGGLVTLDYAPAWAVAGLIADTCSHSSVSETVPMNLWFVNVVRDNFSSQAQPNCACSRLSSFKGLAATGTANLM